MLKLMQKSCALLLCCVIVGGCALTGEKYQRPATNLPGAWQGAAGNQAAWPDTKWWKGFQADELNRLIEDAEQNSHDLRAAAARVAQARANVRIVGAPLYPTIALGANASRNRVTTTTTANLSGTTSYSAYSGLPQFSYGLDIWGDLFCQGRRQRRPASQHLRAGGGAADADHRCGHHLLPDSFA